MTYSFYSATNCTNLHELFLAVFVSIRVIRDLLFLFCHELHEFARIFGAVFMVICVIRDLLFLFCHELHEFTRIIVFGCFRVNSRHSWPNRFFFSHELPRIVCVYFKTRLDCNESAPKLSTIANRKPVAAK